MTKVSDWFFLKPSRRTFKPSVIEDSNLFFCNQDIADTIKNKIEKAYALSEKVQLVLIGNWGAGKTHTVHHLAWWLDQKQSDYPASTVIVEVGDVSKKSRFDLLVNRFLEEIGIERIIDLVHGYNLKIGGNLVNNLQSLHISKNVADAFQIFLLTPPNTTPAQQVQSAYNFLKGQAIKGQDIGLHGKLTESHDLYSVLAALGQMVAVVEEKQLLLIADEAAKLERVEADDETNAHWTSVNRFIFDDENRFFGFIYTLAGQDQDELPTHLTERQVENRIGNENYIQLDPLSDAEVDNFVKCLAAEFVDFEKVKQAVKSGDIKSADYDHDCYPFTKSALKEFVDYWTRNRVDAKPRDVSDRLNLLAFHAMKLGERLINEKVLTECSII